MKILCVLGKYNYGFQSRGLGYEFSNFIPTFEKLGHQVVFFESVNKDEYHDFRELNKSLLDTIELEKPDLLFSVIHTYEIWLETWKIIKDSNITATVNWCTDDNWKYNLSSRYIAPYLHAFITTYPKVLKLYHRDGIYNVLLSQWAANSINMHEPKLAKDCSYKVSFVGTAHGSRKRTIERLKKDGINVACFGYGWKNGPISSEEIPNIMRDSVISLNFANGGLSINYGLLPKKENQIKARTFEVPGSGGFLLSETSNDIEKYYLPGNEIEVFSTYKELRDKIYYYLNNYLKRDEIAFAGFRRTRECHNYEKRLSEVIDFALSKKEECVSKAIQNHSNQINWCEFDQSASLHNTHESLNIMKNFICKAFVLIYGKKRGPRAARRMVFELSWRIFGSKTYSASGLPGRMFYGES